jgi:DNA-binding beta-propeller fold protein YncE
MLARYVIAAALVTLPIRLPKKHGPEVLKQLKDVTVRDIEGTVQHLAADVKGNRIFLAATGKNTIEIFDAQTLRHIDTISGLSQPQDLVFLPESEQLLVSNAADGTLRTYDTKTLKLINSKPMGGDANRIHVTANGKFVIVGWGVGGLAIVDTKSGRRTDVQLKSHPEAFAIDAAGNRMFVNLPGVGEVAVVDRRSEIVTESWSIRQHDNAAMALDEASRRLFVVCRRPSKLLVLNIDDGAIVASMSTVADADDVFFDQRRKRVYVVGGEGQIAVYKQAAPDEYQVMSRTDTVEEARNGLFVPEWNRIFVVARNRPPGFPMELVSFAVLEEATTP